MTRTLVFDGPRGSKRFELLWLALIVGGDGKGERTPPVIRREARLQTALEAISEPVNGSEPPSRALTQDEAIVELTQEDFDHLLQYAEKVPWTPRFAKEVVDMWDWLSAAPRKD